MNWAVGWMLLSAVTSLADDRHDCKKAMRHAGKEFRRIERDFTKFSNKRSGGLLRLAERQDERIRAIDWVGQYLQPIRALIAEEAAGKGEFAARVMASDRAIGELHKWVGTVRTDALMKEMCKPVYGRGESAWKNGWNPDGYTLRRCEGTPIWIARKEIQVEAEYRFSVNRSRSLRPGEPVLVYCQGVRIEESSLLARECVEANLVSETPAFRRFRELLVLPSRQAFPMEDEGRAFVAWRAREECGGATRAAKESDPTGKPTGARGALEASPGEPEAELPR